VLNGASHAGVILSKAPPRLPVPTFHHRLLVLLNRLTQDEMVNEIRWLDAQWS
jgi:hypothetical protein